MNKIDKSYDAIIVGGGHNGLVCAFYLAKKGYKTCVLERSDVVGGAAITEEFHPGFRNSVAAYTVSLLQPKVISDMALYDHGLKVVLRKIDNFVPSEDGYLLSGGHGLTTREFARLSEHDALAYPRYSAALEKVVELIREFLLMAPRAKKPSTTDGTPASTSSTGLRMPRTRRLAYSLR
jgi:phytoene dehydrogenase-like protein